MKAILDKVYSIGAGYATKLGLVLGLISALGLFVNDFLAASCHDFACFLVLFTKSAGALAVFGAVRAWRNGVTK